MNKDKPFTESEATKFPANPCGLVAKSLFNDTFDMEKSGTKIPMDETGIAWESDIQYKFKNL